MEIKLTLPSEFINEITEQIYAKIKPLLQAKTQNDIIFDIKSLCKYLSVSEKWVYERTHLKEIPHLKINGLLRFRKKSIDKWIDSYSVPQTQFIKSNNIASKATNKKPPSALIRQ